MTTNPRPARKRTGLLDVSQLADLLDCSTRTIRRLIESAKLPATREGKGFNVHQRDLYRHFYGYAPDELSSGWPVPRDSWLEALEIDAGAHEPQKPSDPTERGNR